MENSILDESTDTIKVVYDTVVAQFALESLQRFVVPDSNSSSLNEAKSRANSDPLKDKDIFLPGERACNHGDYEILKQTISELKDQNEGLNS